MTVVAMTREMGTRGRDVAKHLVERLNLKIVHPELVEAPFDPDDAPRESEVHRFLTGGKKGEMPSSAWPDGNGYMNPEEVLMLASRGNVVLRGWGAARLLHDIPHILCVRVCAPMADRIAEMMKRLGIDESIAIREIRRSDRSHASAFERFFGTDWRDPLNYNMILNTGRLSPEACADIIIDAARNPAFQETETSRGALADRLAEARIKSLLKTEAAISKRTSDVYSSVSGGVVKLYGATRDRSAARDIEGAIRSQLGYGAIQNDIKTIGASLRSSG